MFNMGFTEIIVLSVIALLVIGPKQLPEVARVIGRMLNEFKRATGDISSSLAGVKKEAQGFANQTQSYMHQQKADFEKKMKESVGFDDLVKEHEENHGAHDQESGHEPGHDDYHADPHHDDEANQMNFDLDNQDSSGGKDS